MIGNKELTFCFEDFYPTNIPYNHMLKDIIDECSSREHRVKVITTVKSDPREQSQMLNFFKTKKIRSTLFKAAKNSNVSSILFSARVFFHLLWHGKGTVIVPSSPPAIMGFSVFLAKYLGGSRFNYIYHCQDIHPEALVISNNINSSLLVAFLGYLDKLTTKYAKKVIVLSDDMKNTLLKRRKKPLNNISIINNFIPSAYSMPSILDNNKGMTIRSNHHEDDSLFVFAGNIGAFQNLELLLEGFLNLTDNKNTHLYFIGEGKVKDILKQQTSNQSSTMKNNVHFLDKMDSDSIAHFISEADYGVVSISDGLLDVAFPSKIATYLSLGLPLFLSGGRYSNIEEEINKNKLGVSINGENRGKVKAGFKEAIKKSSFFKDKHLQIKSYYETNYERKKIISNIIDTF